MVAGVISHTYLRSLAVILLLICASDRALSAQAAKEPSTSSQTPTDETRSEDAGHAGSDAKIALNALKKATKEKRTAVASRLATSLITDPTISSGLKEKARANPQGLLAMNPNQIDKQDKVGFDQKIQQVIDVSLLPIAVLPGGLERNNSNDPLIKAVMARSAELANKAQSVGRIEVAQPNGNAPALVGTAFVVPGGFLMTACHVAKAIAHYDPTSLTWKLNSTTYVDFGSSVTHSPANEFVLNEIASMSSTTGLDIAVIRVAQTSRESNSPLPPPLILGTKQTTKQISIAVIGYPALDYLVGNKDTIDMIGRLRLADPDVAKFASPGQVMSDEVRTSFHVLTHLASTHAGNSGSPVFSLNPVQVVGIHYCCTGVDGTSMPVEPADHLDCSSTAQADIHTNEAIAAPDALGIIPRTSSAWQREHSVVQTKVVVPSSAIGFSLPQTP